MNLYQMGPVWHGAEPLCCTLVKLDLGIQCMASLLCLHGIPLEEYPVLRMVPQMRLTDFHCRLRKWSQASGGHLLVCAETLGCPSFAVLLQHSISILPVLKEMFYSLSVSYLSCDGRCRMRRQEIRFESRSPRF